MIAPLIARAITTREAGHYPQPSDIHGYALEAHGIFNSESDTSALDLSRYMAASAYESGAVSAIYTPESLKKAPVRRVLPQNEEDMLAYIKHRESSGNPTAQNPSSSAYGLFGFLDQTWSSVGCTKTSDPKEQERCALLYMEQRYGGIEGAYRFHVRNNYY